jgi:hypothetical protein
MLFLLIIKEEFKELLHMIKSGILDPWQAMVYSNDLKLKIDWSVMEYCEINHKAIAPQIQKAGEEAYKKRKEMIVGVVSNLEIPGHQSLVT